MVSNAPCIATDLRSRVREAASSAHVAMYVSREGGDRAGQRYCIAEVDVVRGRTRQNALSTMAWFW